MVGMILGRKATGLYPPRDKEVEDEVVMDAKDLHGGVRLGM